MASTLPSRRPTAAGECTKERTSTARISMEGQKEPNAHPHARTHAALEDGLGPPGGLVGDRSPSLQALNLLPGQLEGFRDQGAPQASAAMEVSLWWSPLQCPAGQQRRDCPGPAPPQLSPPHLTPPIITSPPPYDAVLPTPPASRWPPP
ncbi:hypothetical protein G7046_g680 [Stylonectria norvegica]|nr:hypothetical protein G7046_g680 [Stylonectria norvegica]